MLSVITFNFLDKCCEMLSGNVWLDFLHTQFRSERHSDLKFHHLITGKMSNLQKEEEQFR